MPAILDHSPDDWSPDALEAQVEEASIRHVRLLLPVLRPRVEHAERLARYLELRPPDPLIELLGTGEQWELIQAGFASHDPPADDTLWCTLYETTPVQPEQQLPKPLQIRLDVSRARALALYETHLGLPDVLGGFRRGFLAGMIESSEFAGALPPDVVLDQLERLYREAIFAATRSAPAARNALDHLEHIRRTIDSARTKAERRRRPGRIRLAGGHAGQRRSEMEAVWDELLGAHPEPARLVDLALRARDGELPRFGPER